MPYLRTVAVWRILLRLRPPSSVRRPQSRDEAHLCSQSNLIDGGSSKPRVCSFFFSFAAGMFMFGMFCTPSTFSLSKNGESGWFLMSPLCCEADRFLTEVCMMTSLVV